MSQQERLLEEQYICNYLFMKMCLEGTVCLVSVVPLRGVTCSNVDGKIVLSLQCQKFKFYLGELQPKQLDVQQVG